MADADDRDYSGANSATIAREQRKLERLEASRDAHVKNVKETIASFLKDPEVKKALAKDAMESTRRKDGAFFDGNRSSCFDGAGKYQDDGEVITGYEPRPWEE